MIGLLDIQNYDSLTTCYQNSEEFNNLVSSVIELLVSKTNEHIAESVNLMANEFSKMPENFKACSEQSLLDASKMQEWGDDLQQAKDLDDQILLNIQASWKELKLMIAHARVDHMQGHNFELGMKLGEIMKVLTKGA